MGKKLLSIILAVCLLLPACQPSQEQNTPSNPDFETFTNEIFRSYVTSDSLTLNYTLASPENYGITELPDGFPRFSANDNEQNITVTENTLERLRQFSKKDLSFQDQILQDVLACSLEDDLKEAKYLRYSFCFDPSSGIQAQLPVLLSEFIFNDKTDIDQYFALIRSLPDYFSSLLSLEQSKTNTRPCRHTIQNTIAQCREFLNSSGAAPIRSRLESSLAKLPFLSAAEQTALLQKYDDYQKRYLLPAYHQLTRGLEKLVSDAPEDGSLASYPEGKKYYALLLRRKTGSSLSPEQLKKELTETLTTAEQNLFSIAAKNPSAFTNCETYAVRYTDPKQILTTLQKKITADFPSLSRQSCHIHYVDPSLEDFLSPAFYLTPPIDEKTANVIYINNSAKYRHSGLFNTLAHEAWPGHLFQNCYMRQKKMNPLRYVLNFPGYTEGYATYVEIYSYQYLGAPAAETQILQNNAISTHCLYALCDLGIHYYHWDLEQLTAFLQAHGIYSNSGIESIYHNIIDSPGSYLPYTVGYWEIIKLKERFRQMTGSSYTDQLFHTCLLDMGPAPFFILNKYFSSWIEKKDLQ